MTPDKLIPQNLSRELDCRRSVSDHGSRARNIREDRHPDTLMCHKPDNTHHAFARIFESGTADINILDVHGLYQFQTAHSQLPKRANHLRGNLGKCGALAASEFDNYPQSYAVSFSEHMTFVKSVALAKNSEVHLRAGSAVNPPENSRAATTTARTASRPHSAQQLQSSLAG